MGETRGDPNPTEGTVESLKGRLLISGGGLYDPRFRHTVVLVGEHDARGAVGVIPNRVLSMTVAEAVPSLASLVEPDAPLFEGGPVRPEEPVLLVETTRPDLLDVPVLGSVGFLTGEVPEAVLPAILRAQIFAGHAGWGAGQLDSELEADARSRARRPRNPPETPNEVRRPIPAARMGVRPRAHVRHRYRLRR